MKFWAVIAVGLLVGFTIKPPALPKKKPIAKRALAGQLMARSRAVTLPPLKTNLTFTWTPVVPPVAASLQVTRDFKTWSNVSAVDTSKGIFVLTNGVRQYAWGFFRIAVPY